MLERINGPEDLGSLSDEELSLVAQDCREMIIRTITRRGGHLASNLGVVELTLALHRSFRSPVDRLVWDTSNQCYTHKLVTGRRDQFETIRTPGGLSGFAEPEESVHDTLAAGHAGTGLSYALGMAQGLQQDHQNPFVVAVVGDGALTSGPSYEALNNIVHLRPKRLIVVLNDNGWSISENIGWLTYWRNRLILNPQYVRLKKAGHSVVSRLPHGEKAWKIARKIKSRIEGLVLPNLIWEELGFHYIGPIDGHDIREAEESLRQAKDIAAQGEPVIVHALTHKGRGYKEAEANPSRFHQPGTPSAAAGPGARFTYSQVFAKTLIRMMERDPKIVAITAAMLEGTALAEVRNHFPDRVFDVGIAEEHAVIMAAGMAKAGLKPVVSIYSTFLQRAFDQLIHDIALQNLPVTICIDRAGLVGDDGKTHQGIFDIGYTRMIPNLTIAAPRDENELQHLLFTAIESGRPFALRYPRGLGLGVRLDDELHALPIGGGEVLREGNDVVLLGYGSMVQVALDAAELLADRGISCGVASQRFVKPLSLEVLGKVSRMAPRVLTLEEHLASGGFGSAVLEAFQAQGWTGCDVRVHGIPDQFVDHAPAPEQRALFRLDVEGVAAVVQERFPELFRAKLVHDATERTARASGTANERVRW